MKNKAPYDVIVIGAGPGGYTAAFRASDLGRKVLIIDSQKNLGGECLNFGCIPSKALLHISHSIDHAIELNKVGVSFDSPQININGIRKHKEKIVSHLNSGINQMSKARNIDIMHGKASFVNNKTIAVELNNEKIKLEFKNLIIATGSRPKMPTFGTKPTMDRLWTSKDALDLKEIPSKLLVIGGGYIGLELGSVYQSLGSEVTVVEFMDHLLPGADEDMVRPLSLNLKKHLESVRLSSKVEEIKFKNNKFSVKILSNKKTEELFFDKVLCSIGRFPNTDNLSLENTDITIKDNFISVDQRQRTNIEGIYAIGDVTGDPMLAHKASHEGKIAAEVISGLPSIFDTNLIPAVIYTHPEIAWIGFTEKELKSNNIQYKKSEFPWAANGRALSMGNKTGKTKLLFDPSNNSIIGAAIVGPSAGDLISELALAMEVGSKPEDISLTIHPHPTLSETIKNANEIFEGTITDLYIPKK